MKSILGSGSSISIKDCGKTSTLHSAQYSHLRLSCFSQLSGVIEKHDIQI